MRSLGAHPDPDDPGLLKRIAYMPQSLGLYRELSCRENMELQAELRGIPPAEAASPAARASLIGNNMKTPIK